MKLIGIDLAGNPRNDTGFCVLEIKDDKKIVRTEILHSDSEIMEKIKEVNPDLIAIDAPLTFSGINRKCDEELQKYGTLPVTLRGMEILAKRGSRLAEELRKENFKLIEIFATGTAKILGLYDSLERNMQKNLLNSGILGDTEKRLLSRDELDSIFAAITGYLYLNNSAESVGDENGRIIIPKL